MTSICKKIGILTYFWADNPGTFLQAHSCLEALKEKLPLCRIELINFKHRKVRFEFRKSHANPKIFREDLTRYYKYKLSRKKHLMTSADKMTTQSNTDALHFIAKQKYDLIVVGADTILNPLEHNIKRRNIPVYWLPSELKCKKVMCASSARALTINQIDKRLRKKMRQSINDFDLLGVRDHATFNLIKDLGLNDASKMKMIPDPTFTYKINYEYSKRILQKKRIDLTRPTIALNIPKSLNLGTQLANHYKKNGFQILVLNRERYGDIQLSDISPFEWAGITKGVQLVITDRFHGTLFCLKNKTPVLTLVSRKNLTTKNGLSKYFSLLKPFNLNKSNLMNVFDVQDIGQIIKKADTAMISHDYKFINKKLKAMENTYRNFVEEIANLMK